MIFCLHMFTGIPEWSVPSPVSLPIPESTCRGPLALVWPTKNGEESAFCLLSNNDIGNFDNCTKNYKSDYNITFLEERSVIISFKYTKSFLIHFICEVNPCMINRDICDTSSIIASYLIILPDCKLQTPYNNTAVLIIYFLTPLAEHTNYFKAFLGVLIPGLTIIFLLIIVCVTLCCLLKREGKLCKDGKMC